LELDLIAVRKERDDLIKRLEAAGESEGQEGGDGQGSLGRRGVGNKGEIAREQAEKIGEIQKRKEKGEIEQMQGNGVEGKQRLEELKGLLGKQADDIASLKAEVMGLRRERDSLSVERDALGKETQELTKERDALGKETQELTKERDAATAQVTGFAKERDALRAEVASLTEERDATSGQRDARAESLSKEVMSLKRENEGLARRCKDAEKKLNASKGGGGEAVDVLCGELDMISRKCAALEKEASQLRSDKEEIEVIRGERDALSAQISSLEESIKAQKVENASLSEQVHALVAERDVLSDQVKTSQRERDTLMEIKDAAEAAIQV